MVEQLIAMDLGLADFFVLPSPHFRVHFFDIAPDNDSYGLIHNAICTRGISI